MKFLKTATLIIALGFGQLFPAYAQTKVTGNLSSKNIGLRGEIRAEQNQTPKGNTTTDAQGNYTLQLSDLTHVQETQTQTTFKGFTGGTNLEGNQGNFKIQKNNEDITLRIIDELGQEFKEFTKTITGPPGTYTINVTGSTNNSRRPFLYITGKNLSKAIPMYGYNGKGTPRIQHQLQNAPLLSKTMDVAQVKITYTANGFYTKDTTINIPLNTEKELNIQLNPAGQIRGTVKNKQTQENNADAKITIMHEGKEYNHTYTNTNGEYILETPTGQTQIKFTENGYHDLDTIITTHNQTTLNVEMNKIPITKNIEWHFTNTTMEPMKKTLKIKQYGQKKILQPNQQGIIKTTLTDYHENPEDQIQISFNRNKENPDDDEYLKELMVRPIGTYMTKNTYQNNGETNEEGETYITASLEELTKKPYRIITLNTGGTLPSRSPPNGRYLRFDSQEAKQMMSRHPLFGKTTTWSSELTDTVKVFLATNLASNQDLERARKVLTTGSLKRNQPNGVTVVNYSEINEITGPQDPKLTEYTNKYGVNNIVYIFFSRQGGTGNAVDFNDKGQLTYVDVELNPGMSEIQQASEIDAGLNIWQESETSGTASYYTYDPAGNHGTFGERLSNHRHLKDPGSKFINE